MGRDPKSKSGEQESHGRNTALTVVVAVCLPLRLHPKSGLQAGCWEGSRNSKRLQTPDLRLFSFLPPPRQASIQLRVRVSSFSTGRERSLFEMPSAETEKSFFFEIQSLKVATSWLSNAPTTRNLIFPPPPPGTFIRKGMVMMMGFQSRIALSSSSSNLISVSENEREIERERDKD